MAPRLTLEGLAQKVDDFEAIVGNHAREVSALAAEVRRLAERPTTRTIQLDTNDYVVSDGPLPRNDVPKMSWHQQLAQKQVPMGRAVGWSTVALAALELLHAIADGHFRFW